MIVAGLFADDRILVTVPSYCNDAMKLMPGSEFRDGRWTVPLSWGSCLRLRSTFGDQLQLGSDLWLWAGLHKDLVVEPARVLRDQVDADGDPRLYSFQRAGALMIKTTGRILLADEVGSGKTIQLIMSDRPKPILVVAPKSMLYKWKQEFEKWEPGVNVTVATGAAKARKMAIETGDVVIINWHLLQKHSRLAPFGGLDLSDIDKKEGELNWRKWSTVVFDEAQAMQSPKSKWTRAAWQIGHQPTVESAVAMTGTPIANHMGNLWSVMHAIDPDEYPSKSKWMERYALQGWNQFGGLDVIGIKPETSAEFFEILDYRFRRMPKAVTMPFLPPIIGGLSDPNGLQVREIEMDPKQKKAYEEMRDKMVAELESGLVITTSPLQRALRMMQFAQAYAEVTSGTDGPIVRLSEPSNKVDALEELLEEFEGEPLVVFSASRQLINLCRARLDKLKVRHSAVIGGQGALERQEHIDSFQNGYTRAILCVSSAGATGITLTRSRIEIILNRSHSLIENIQLEGRIHRIGSEQHENVMYLDVVSKGTIEPSVVEALYRKDDNLQEICRDEQTLLKLLKGA